MPECVREGSIGGGVRRFFVVRVRVISEKAGYVVNNVSVLKMVNPTMESLPNAEGFWSGGVLMSEGDILQTL